MRRTSGCGNQRDHAVGWRQRRQRVDFRQLGDSFAAFVRHRSWRPDECWFANLTLGPRKKYNAVAAGHERTPRLLCWRAVLATPGTRIAQRSGRCGSWKAPTWSVVGHVPLVKGLSKIAMAVALSLALCTATAQALLWLRAWYPSALLGVLGGLSLLALVGRLAWPRARWYLS